MIIVVTPYVEDVDDCRVIDLKKNGQGNGLDLVEPHWYSNTHPDVFTSPLASS